jgi:hypothetical protein
VLPLPPSLPKPQALNPQPFAHCFPLCDLRLFVMKRIFLSFTASHPAPQAVASGTVAQVHRARLRASGEEVAVKVRHPQVCNETFVDINVPPPLPTVAPTHVPTVHETFVDIIVGPARPHHPLAPAHSQPRAARLAGRLIFGRS